MKTEDTEAITELSQAEANRNIHISNLTTHNTQSDHSPDNVKSLTFH